MKIKKILAELSSEINKEKESALKSLITLNSELYHAAEYSFVNDSAKNLRSLLLCVFAGAFGASKMQYIKVAVAIELIHCYSLIHDDLPALDNDDFRRGRESLHKKTSESTAILTGDGLLISAFYLLSQVKGASGLVPKLISSVASSVGFDGMILGQFLDLGAKNDSPTEEMFFVHEKKSATLFACSCECAGIVGSVSKQMLEVLFDFGLCFGNALQIADDIRDFYKQENVNIAQKLGIEEASKMLEQRRGFISKKIYAIANLALKSESSKLIDCIGALVEKALQT